MINLEKGANLHIRESEVPQELCALIPLVKKWGFESLDDQDAFVAAMNTKRPEELQEFNRVLDLHGPRIRAWGRKLSQFEKPISEFTVDDWAHPYWGFLRLLKVREVTGSTQSCMPMDLDTTRTFNDEVKRERFNKALPVAEEAFRCGDFAAFIQTLEEFRDMFTKSQIAKFDIAKRRQQRS